MELLLQEVGCCHQVLLGCFTDCWSSSGSQTAPANVSSVIEMFMVYDLVFGLEMSGFGSLTAGRVRFYLTSGLRNFAQYELLAVCAG